jgi:cytochrome oxidase Cu insertion factor (SCO1/SenC/PrrC family)
LVLYPLASFIRSRRINVPSFRTLVVVSGLACLMAGSAPGQQNRPGNRGPGGELPAVGSMLPDVALYDEHGEEFSTTSLRGQHSVLVFGCLT